METSKPLEPKPSSTMLGGLPLVLVLLVLLLLLLLLPLLADSKTSTHSGTQSRR
jgi:hypothetical protein